MLIFDMRLPFKNKYLVTYFCHHHSFIRHMKSNQDNPISSKDLFTNKLFYLSFSHDMLSNFFDNDKLVMLQTTTCICKIK